MKDQRLALLIIAAAAIYFLVLRKRKEESMEHYTQEEENNNVEVEYDNSGDTEDVAIPETSDQAEPETGNCPGFVSSDLLPREDKTDDFAEFSPANVDSNFLDSARFLSMQTSLIRNPNLQIRPEPEVPRKEVCPWNQSTIYRENTEPAKNHDTLDF